VNLLKTIACAWALAACVAWNGPIATAADIDPAEQRLWQMALDIQAEDEHRNMVLHDAQLDLYIQRTTKRLWQHVDSDLPEPVVRIILTPQLKAQAYPNGVCDLSSGMLAHVGSEDQLAMIMAHEFVHYARRHAFHAFGHLQMSFSRDSHLPGAVETERTTPQAISDFVEAAEQEADQQGLAIMQAAGYCPEQVLQLLKSFLPDNGRRLSKQGQAASDIRKRIHLIRKQLVELSVLPCAGPSAAPDGFLRRLAPVMLANAQAAVRHGLWNQAQTDIERYLAVRPDDARGYFVLGEIHTGLRQGGAMHQALAAYQQAIGLDDTFADAHRALGFLYLKLGQNDQARPHFERCLNLAPGDMQNSFIQAYLGLCSKPAKPARLP
jgi:predicted Zn-dependent protease